MTRREALLEGARILAAERRPGTETPSLDASLLLSFALGITRESLIASYPLPLEAAAYEAYLAFIGRRARGESVAYILGRKEFWGRDFAVDARVLVPRPDTELLVETALGLGAKIAADKYRLCAVGEANRKADEVLFTRVVCHEACTGSGCVAISVAAEKPDWEVSASDISPGALEVASRNAAALLPPDRPGGALELHLSDLLQAARGPFDLILANPPYVPSSEASHLALDFSEPLLALDGGEDGFEPYRRLIPEAASRLSPGGWLALEADPEQASSLREFLSAQGFCEVETLDDLAGRPRVTKGRR
jgi:release factor glutamine methyltransferase